MLSFFCGLYICFFSLRLVSKYWLARHRPQSREAWPILALSTISLESAPMPTICIVAMDLVPIGGRFDAKCAHRTTNPLHILQLCVVPFFAIAMLRMPRNNFVEFHIHCSPYIYTTNRYMWCVCLGKLSASNRGKERKGVEKEELCILEEERTPNIQ